MEPSAPSPIEQIIAGLGKTDKPLLNSQLIELSNLSLTELGFFEQVWTAIETKRRQQVMYRLVELAEDNFELSFDNIFIGCLKDQDAEVRSKAIEGLWENEEAFLINPLIDLLEHDSSEKVQVAAAIALGKFAMLAEHEKLRPSHLSKIGQALLLEINNASKAVEVRRRALEAAAPLSLPQVAEAIKQAYQGQGVKLRVSSIYAMGKNCDPSWLPILLKELASSNNEIRYEAAGACGELGEKEAVPYLIKLSSDPDANVQLAAIRALGKIGGTAARKHLRECLNNPSEVIHQAAEQALDGLEIGEDPFSFQVWPP